MLDSPSASSEKTLRSQTHKQASEIVGFFIQKHIHEIMQYNRESKSNKNKQLYQAMYDCANVLSHKIEHHFNFS